MRNSRRTKSAARGAVAALALTAGLLTVGAGTAADWPQLRGNPQRSGISSEAIKLPLAVLWRFTGGSQAGNITSPVVMGGTVYFTTRASAQGGGILYALDAKTGQKKWAFPNDNGLTGGHYFPTTPTVEGGRIYAGSSDGSLYVIDAATGKEVAGPFSVRRKIESSPLVTDGTLFFGANDGLLYALNPETGEKRWSRFDQRTRRVVGFNYDAGEAISSAPMLVGDMLIFTTADNTLHGIKEATGNFRWKNRIPFAFLPNGMTFAGSSVFLASGPALVSILPTSGTERWRAVLPDDILAAPAVADGIAYVGCRNSTGDGGLLYAIKDNGRPYWKSPAKLPFVPAGAPVVSGDVIFLPASRGVILGLSKETGGVLWQYRISPSVNRANATPRTEASVASPLAISDGTLFSVSDDGTLTAFRSDAPDTTGPVISELYPRAGTAQNGKAPFVIAAKVEDLGSGLNPSSIVAVLDDKEVEMTFDAKRSLLIYQTKSTGQVIDRPLADGRHQFTIKAKDWRGNETETSWSFVIDNTLPKQTRENNTNNQRNSGPGGGSSGPGGKGGGGG